MSRVTLDLDAAGIARVTFTGAERRNAIDVAFVRELQDALDVLAGEDRLRTVLVRAEGPAFTVGGDLRSFHAQIDDLGGALREIVPAFQQAVLSLGELPVPVVAAVQGAIAGGGLGLAYCSDVVIAADDAVFATGFARIALSGDGGSSWWLPRLVGIRRAQEMLLRDRVLRASEALEWGIVTEVVAPDQLVARAEEVAAAFAAGPSAAYAQMRDLLRRAPDRTLAEHLAAEAEGMVACGRTPEAREGITAFLEKRAPRW